MMVILIIMYCNVNNVILNVIHVNKQIHHVYLVLQQDKVLVVSVKLVI